MKMYRLLLSFIFIIGTYAFANESTTTDVNTLKEKVEVVKKNLKEVPEHIVKAIKDEESCIEKDKIQISKLEEFLNALGTPQEASITFDLRPFGINLEVAKEDEPDYYTFSEAKEACESKGMRVPTITELGQMYCHGALDVNKKSKVFPDSDPGCNNSKSSDTIKNLSKTWYWSSESDDGSIAIIQTFCNGFQVWHFGDIKRKVRCVRSFNYLII